MVEVKTLIRDKIEQIKKIEYKKYWRYKNQL